MRQFFLLPVVVAIAIASFGVSPAKLRAAEEEAFLNPKKAGDDVYIQGEYSGDVQTAAGPKPYGVQVIAEGGGKFTANMFEGGLPGAGAGKKPVETFTGTAVGNVMATFKGCTLGNVTVKNAAMLIEDPVAGTLLGALERQIRESKTLGMKPPKGAVLLHDSTDKDFAESTIGNWEAVKEGASPELDQEMLCPGVNSKIKFQDCILHVEFMTPFMPKSRGQARGNSGVYLQGRYEVQILDSFGLEGKDNECGGIYTVKAPDVNMCFPPLQWQTYDIKYTAAKYDAAGKKTADAQMIVVHNGVRIHTNVKIPKATTSHVTEEGPEPGFLHLQDHGCPVRFRNIWIRGDGIKPLEEAPPEEAKPDEAKPDDAKPDEAPADETPADQAKPKPEDAKPEDEKPADEAPADDKSADEKPGDEPPPEEAPSDEAPK